jgi:hypothetical protein
VTLSDLRGKDVMIILPRGLARPDRWCDACPYQHPEFAEYEAETGFRDRANLEILFVLLYSYEKIDEFTKAYSQLLKEIDDLKNP